MSNELPHGLCACGCGELPPLATHTNNKRGVKKGQPVRYVHGHNRRKSFTTEYLIDPVSGCWIWQRAMGANGYGLISQGRRSVPAHRYVYEREKGLIPGGLHLDHLCRNPSCVNPDHLEPVTAAENTRRGLNAKLSMELVREIRCSDLPGVELARRYGVTPATISHIRLGHTWREDRQ